MSIHKIRFLLNGEPVKLVVHSNKTLLDVLRYNFNMTGTKKGCNRGDCGACTVLLDGKPVLSCMILAPQVHNHAVTTIEGLGEPTNLHPLQKAFIKHSAVQCGFCTPGMILSAKALLDENPAPTTNEIKEALSGNLCRCTGYIQIIEAIMEVAGENSLDKETVVR